MGVEKPFSIYLIADLTEPGWYVGSAWGSSTPKRRFSLHMRQKGGAKRINERVAAGDKFNLAVLERGIGERVHALECEEEWIAVFQELRPGETLNANLYPTQGIYALGGPMSDETKAKIGAANAIALKGKKRPDLSAMKKGVPNPKNSARMKGQPNPNKGKKFPEWGIKLRGKKRTPEQCARIGNAMRGKKRTFTPGHCAALSKALLKLPRVEVECADCGMVTIPPAMGRHIKATGHRRVDQLP